MTTYFLGIEDIDVDQNYYVDSTGTYHRSTYSRCALRLDGPGAATKQIRNLNSFTSLTSAWLHSYMAHSFVGTNADTPILGLCASGTLKGIFWGCGDDSKNFALFTYDGSTITQLAIGTSDAFGAGVIDMQLISYGASPSSGTLNLYKDGVPQCTYTGDISISGVSGFDEVGIYGYKYCGSIFTDRYAYISEVMVADSDTRNFVVATLVPNGAGDTNAWTGDYTDIDEISVSDADLIYSNTVDQDAQFALSNCPGGSYSVDAIKIAARATAPAGSTANKLKLGINSGGTPDLDSGQSLTTAWATYDRYMTQINGGQITTALLDAGQINHRSAS